MNLNLFGWISNAFTWAKEHLWTLALILAGILAAILLFFLLRWIISQVKVAQRREAVKRSLKTTFKSARAAGRTSRTIWTTGNGDVDPRCWGKVLGVRPTSHALYVEARPMKGGPLKYLRPRRFIIARHLVPDIRADRLEVRALGMNLYEDVWWPDDDFTSGALREEWTNLLEEEGIPRARVLADLPGEVVHWYLRLIKLGVIPQETMTAYNNQMLNWHLASSTPLEESRRILRNEHPAFAEQRRDGSNASQNGHPDSQERAPRA